MDQLLKTALLRTFGVFLLIFLSPWLFVHVEYTEIDHLEEKYQLLLSLYDSMASKYNMTIEEFNNFSNVAYEALSVPKPQWTYFAAIDFVAQAVTTIGYGYITPQTPAGQILCIFVSLLGIPITLLALKSVGELIAKWVNVVVTKFEKKIFKREEPKQVQTKSSVILFSMMIALMLSGAYSTVTLFNLTFVEGVYSWFITFTTIGFGDYVLRQTQRIKQLSVNGSVIHKEDGSLDAEGTTSGIFEDLFLTFYYILSLCIVSSVLNSIMAAIEERKCRPRCPGCVPRKTQDRANNKQYNTEEQREADHVTSEQYNTPQQSETGITY